jgi:ComF family protein
MLELPWLTHPWIPPNDTIHPFLFRHPSLSGVISPLEYADPVSTAIQALKYRGQTTWIETLALCIHLNWPAHIATPSFWIPIPLHRSRYQQRGFNQALFLAKELARLQGGIVLSNLLIRTQATRSSAQEKLDKEERLRELHDTFGVRPIKNMSKITSACLVDDVLTTGATLSIAAEILYQAGIQSIIATTVARTFSPST